MGVGGSQNPISVLSDTEPKVPAGPSTLVPIEDPVPVPAPEDSQAAPHGVVGVQRTHWGRCCYPHTMQLGRRSSLRLMGLMTMLRVLTPRAVADLLGELDSEGATEFWIWDGDDEAMCGVGYNHFVIDQIEDLLEESEVETLVGTPEA